MKSNKNIHQNKYQSIFSKRQTNNTLREHLSQFVQNNDFQFKKNQTHHYNNSLSSNSNFLNVLKKTHLNSSTSFLDSNGIRSSKQSSKIEYDDDIENIEPSELIEKLKQTIHSLKKKEASKRLQISKLKTQVQQYSDQIKKMRQSFKNYEIKATKDNEYILKLDIQLRNTKEELLKLKKNTTKSEKLKELENQNQEMRFVISQLLLQLENKEAKIQKQNSSKEEFQKLQNIHELMKDITINNSNSTSRKSSLNALEFTMNPQPEQYITKKTQYLSYPNIKNQNTFLNRNTLEIVKQESQNSKIYLETEQCANEAISEFVANQNYNNRFLRYNNSFQQYQQ